MLRGVAGQGPGSAGSFSSITIAQNSSGTGSGTQLFDDTEITINAASQTEVVTIAKLGKVSYTGSGGFGTVGHGIGLMGYGVINSSGQTVPLFIGSEGKMEYIAGSATNTISVQAGLANVASGCTAATHTNVNSSVSGNSGTITNLNHFRANLPIGTAPGNIICFNALNQAGTSSTIGFYGQLTAGTGKFNIAIPSGGAPAIFGAAANTGNGAIVQISGASGLEIATDRGQIFTGQTSSAASNTGTLTNSPATGNPAFWLRVKVNGTNGAIPIWLG